MNKVYTMMLILELKFMNSNMQWVMQAFGTLHLQPRRGFWRLLKSDNDVLTKLGESLS